MDEEIGLIYLDPEEAMKNPTVNKRIGAVLREELERAIALIEENRAAIDALVSELMVKNHLRGDEIHAVLSAHAKREEK